MQQKILGTFIITLFLAETFFIYPNVDFSEIQNSNDSVMPEHEFTPDNVNKLLTNTPVAFTENRGQLKNNEVRFYTRGGGLWFTDDGIWFEIREEIIQRDQWSELRGQGDSNPLEGFEPPEPMEYKRVILKQEFVGANLVHPIGRDRLSWNSNFFYGNDSSKWCKDVPNYREVYYENIYDCIDLSYYINENGLKYDLIVHPGGEVDNIRIKYEGADGLEIDEVGNLKIETACGNIEDGELFIYQDFGGSRHSMMSNFKIYGNFEYGFEILQNYNEQEVLVIDPKVTLNYSTFIGGSNAEWGWDLAIDQIGNVYISGWTNSPDFPNTTGAYDQNLHGDSDIFVIKLDKDYITIYSTYIGGDNVDLEPTIAVESNGNAFITGWTGSSDFPTTPGVYDRINGDTDVFVLKLDSSGSDLLYSTFVGGSGYDKGCITIDSMGNAFVTGFTRSSDFPTTPGAYDRSYNGGVDDDDAFIFKLDQTGSKLIYSTYIGGNKLERAFDIAIDSMGNSYVAGTTNSSDFPTTTNAFNNSFNGGYDVFVLKLNQNGTSLIYSTYFGGKKIDLSSGISLDSIGNVYITGRTDSADFPNTTGAYDQTYNNNNDFDGFVFKLNHNGSKLIFSTFIGGTEYDRTRKITYDLTGNLYIVGDTGSYDFPTTDDAFDSTLNPYDIFLIKLSSNGSNLLYSTFIGGSDHDLSTSIVSDSIGNVYLTGMTGSLDFPNTTGKYNGGIEDAFLFKFSVPKNINVNSLSLIFNNTPVNRVYSRLDSYNFRVNITDPISSTNLGILRLNLDPLGTNIQLLWNRATGQFTKSNDPNNFITLEPTSSAKNKHIYLSLSQWTVNFNVTFNWNYPDEKPHDVHAYATSATIAPAWFNATVLYHVENDLVFNGTLSVTNENNRTIADGELVRGGEKLNWTGLKPVYEGSTDIYPPTDEFDVNIWNEAGNSWSDSPAIGENFTTQTVTASATDTDGDTHVINITGIPPECDATNETFTIRIDGDNVTFSNPIPDKNIWQTTADVEVSINITDIGGGFVNGSSVKYCFSSTNGTNWSEWIGFLKLKSGVSVNPQDVVFFPDRINNLVKWQAGDSVRNGPVESEEYRILVDTKNVTFSNGYPTKQNESTKENVEVGITISDVTSGVDASTVEYAISSNYGATWGPWVPITGIKDDKSINVSLNLTFQNGTGNRIKWRASDIAGNGPKESEVYVIRVNTWVAKVPIPKVKLWNPPNGSVISSTVLELSWRLLNKNLLNVTYNVYLDTINPPVKINHSGVINTTVIIDNLSNGETYYWTVIPKTENINGSCESGVWSFTVNIPIPKINLISPENNSIINDFQPGLSWSVEYDGTEILSYYVYFGTSEDPELEFKDHPSTNCFIKERLTDGETYYWKVVPWAGNTQGPASEIWSFIIKKEYIPYFELELFILPPVIELPPGDITQVKAIVTNLGELEDSILLRIEVPPDSDVGAIVDEPSVISVIPHAIAEFNIIVTTSMDAPIEEEVILTVIATSRRAPEFGLIVEERSELTVKILNKEKTDEDNPWLSLSQFWIIFLIIIIILIVMIIVWVVIRQKKTSQETKEESATEDALTVKPGTVPEAEISVGKAPPTITSPQLPETTAESEKPTSQIVKVPTLETSTTPGQVPEPNQIPQVTQVPQLPYAQPETSETIEESAEEPTPTLDKPMDIQQETDQNSQEKN